MFLVILILLSACASFADTLRETTRPCRIERLDHAYALCVDALSDARELAMHDAVGQTLGSLQATTPEELGELEARYAGAQQAWLRAVEDSCGRSFPDAPRGRAECRLQAVLARAEQIKHSLARAADDLGGRAEYDIPVPDAVEVIVPLPGFPNGPRQRIRVPLVVPVMP